MYVAGAKKRKDGSFPITFVNISDAALRQSSVKHIEERNSAKYIEKNEIFVRNFVKWLVNRNRKSNLMKKDNHHNLVGAAKYELDFRKFDKIADDACDYFRSKKRFAPTRRKTTSARFAPPSAGARGGPSDGALKCGTVPSKSGRR